MLPSLEYAMMLLVIITPCRCLISSNTLADYAVALFFFSCLSSCRFFFRHASRQHAASPAIFPHALISFALLFVADIFASFAIDRHALFRQAADVATPPYACTPALFLTPP